MKCIILSARPVDNGLLGRLFRELQKGDLVICADGGYQNALRAEIRPDVVVGDFDSLDVKTVADGVEVIRHPSQKDYTDTYLAVRTGFSRGYTEFWICGATGGRFDHTYANVCLLDYILKRGGKGKILEEEGELTLHDAPFALEGKRGRTISFFPFDGDVEGLTLTGFFYPLENHRMSAGEPIGVSNVAVSNRADVFFRKGRLFCYICRNNA